MEDDTKPNQPDLGGRPNLAGEEVLAHRLVTRVNERDKRAIDADFSRWQTGRAGRIADYLREIILGRNAINPTQSPRTDTEEILELTQTLHHIRQHLKHIDTNYNQITRRINSIDHTGKLYHEVKTSQAVIATIEPLIAQIETLVKAQTEAFFKPKDGH